MDLHVQVFYTYKIHLFKSCDKSHTTKLAIYWMSTKSELIGKTITMFYSCLMKCKIFVIKLYKTKQKYEIFLKNVFKVLSIVHYALFNMKSKVIVNGAMTLICPQASVILT